MKRVAQRVTEHPILPIPGRKEIHFTFNRKKYEAYEGEVISSALFAQGIKIFGHHHRDGGAQGIFCANGQCAQCMVIADSLPVKACMAQVRDGMKIVSCDSLPELPAVKGHVGLESFDDISTIDCEVLIIGAGPSGITAAIELGKCGKDVILIDDKSEPGGKLVLQTHTFFGSISDCHAGTRGIDIAVKLSEELKKHPAVKLWLNTTAVGVFYDRKVGVIRDGEYVLISPKKLLISSGAREKALSFPGWDLPGVYGAGAFQTLLNRDLVRPSERLFIVGGGNVGIIAGYHALQAGIKVVGLVEALPHVGGYLVHAHKLRRFGVPFYTSHTVLRCDGDSEGVKSITICEVDKSFKPVKGTNKSFSVDTVLVAVGLNPIDELYRQAKDFGVEVYAAGDAEEIAEASAAMFSGKIKGLEIAAALGEKVCIPAEWRQKNEILKQKPGNIYGIKYSGNGRQVFPVFHCIQEIPCNPCTEVCPNKSIAIEKGGLMGIPSFEGKCSGCMKCVAICPGLAITLIDRRKCDDKSAIVTIPFELSGSLVAEGKEYEVVDLEGEVLGKAPLTKIWDRKFQDRTLLLSLQVERSIADKVAGIRILEIEKPEEAGRQPQAEDVIVCRCERVTRDRIVAEIQDGVRDLNELKAKLRCGMGSCGGKTCTQLIERLYREAGVKPDELTTFTQRPVDMEAPLALFAGMKE